MNIKKILVSFLSAAAIFTLVSCTQFEDTSGDWNNPAAAGFPQDPVITSVSPSDSLMAGVREIVFTGQNFSTDPAKNWIYFGDEKAIIKSASSTQVVAYRPGISGNLTLKFVNSDALPVLHVFNYKVEEPVSAFSDFININTNLFCIEADRNENLWVATRRSIFTVTPDGVLNPFVQDLSPSSVFSKITDIKVGPGGFLYMAVDKRDIYRISMSAAGTPEVYVNIPKNTDFIEFDQAGNLYAGKGDGVYIVDVNKNVTATGRYNDIDITGLRVAGNQLYVSSSSRLYKNTISNNTLGDDQVVFDIAAAPGFSGAVLSSFAIDANGRILLSIKNHPDYSLFVLENGVPVPYYTDNIVPKNIDQLVWGSGRFLYLNRGTLARDSVRVYRMGMDVNGAPYPGR